MISESYEILQLMHTCNYNVYDDSFFIITWLNGQNILIFILQQAPVVLKY